MCIFCKAWNVLKVKLNTGVIMGKRCYKVENSFSGFRNADRWSPQNVSQACGVSSVSSTRGKELSCEDPRYHLFWQRLSLCIMCVCVCGSWCTLHTFICLSHFRPPVSLDTLGTMRFHHIPHRRTWHHHSAKLRCQSWLSGYKKILYVKCCIPSKHI